ncbi:MAG: TIM barrel protein [Candidatus Woesearchaeota archaeon]
MTGRILLGPAGSPEASTVDGVFSVARMGLSALEVEFTHGIKMQRETAVKIFEAAKQTGVRLSVHAPYFINLASEDKQKARASRERILRSAELASLMGASPVVFHAAYYGRLGAERCYEIVKDEINIMQDALKENGWRTELAPETTGKPSQFGTLEELLRLRRETGCSFCVDFAHILARNGSVDYDEVLKKLVGMPNIHSHFSGIEYSSKGERYHKVMSEEEIRKLLLAVLKSGVSITIISESPITWQDSLKMKRILEELRV